MTQRQLRWHQPLSFLAIAGVLCLSSHSASAQLTPIADDTLGNERSIVTPFNPTIDVINGGARRGANLFHSFREFNVGDGRGVYFTNPAGVANILTRVTGGNSSQILGTLGVLGNANLFLLNPNGILFGANAQLDVGGSFLASTANSVVFGNGFAFSATDPQAPPLLTVNVPVGLQYGSNPGAIQVQGSFLQVPDGQTLTLAGGAVNVDGAGLFAFGGRIELAGVAASGEVGLMQQGLEWRLSVPDGLTRADVEISGGAFVSVRAGGGGSLAIAARNLTVSGLATRVRAGIEAGSGAVGTQAGDIDINATESVNVDASLVSNAVLPSGIGSAGNISITSGVLSLSSGAQVSAPTFGQGDAGNITITTRDAVSIDGVDINRSPSAVASSVGAGATGQGGDISITTGTLSLTNGGEIIASTSGRGDAGNITIRTRDAVFLDGVGSGGSPSGPFSGVDSGAIGQGGDISITTGTLSLTNGGQIIANTRGQGDAGNITITVRDAVSFDGVNDGGLSSAAFSTVDSGAIGQGGGISITTGSLSLTNGAQIVASTRGQGDAGNITITARDLVSFDGVNNSGASTSGAFSAVGSNATGQGGDISIATGSLSITNGGAISTPTFGQGNAGNITITARDLVSFDGVGNNGSISRALSPVGTSATGQGGNISITTGTLSLTNGGELVAATQGLGDAGNITIIARDAVSFDGVGSNGLYSGAFSTVDSGAKGQGGNIAITTGTLSLTNGSLIDTSTAGQGNAGDITIMARDAVSFDGMGSSGFSSGAFSIVDAEAEGQGGTITVNTVLLSITNGGILSASSNGKGDAGSLSVNARQLRLDNQGSIVAETASGQGGNITLQVSDLLLLRRGSSISTTAGTAQAGGDGGNITFNGNFIVAVANENSDISANAFTGSGGRVNINAQGLFGIQFRPQLTPLSDITASSDFGVAGVVAINTPDVDPNRGLVQLPVDLTDASRLIVQTCPTGDSLAKQPNEFIITGRGGLPPTPSEAVNRDAIQVDLVTADMGDRPSVSQQQLDQTPQPSASSSAPIIEAQGLQVAANGTVFLVAASPNKAMDRFPDRLVHCR